MRCEQRLEAALAAVTGVTTTTVDWRSGRALVRHERTCEIDALIEAVRAASQGTPHHHDATVITTHDML